MADVGGPLIGTLGDDFILGDARDLSPNGVDNYSNSGDFALRGLAGNDVIVGDLFDSIGYDTEGDEIYGGDGNDLIYGDTAPDLSHLGISSPWLGDTLWDARTSGSSDLIYGGAGIDTIYGGAGGDQMHGGTGNDLLAGQADNDFIYGDQGSDQIDGGDGSDQIYGGAGIDFINGEAGNDFLFGEAFNSSVGDGGDVIRGGDGNDDIRGGAGADTLRGDRGDDTINGAGLSSNASNDLGDDCFGGAGNDFINGFYGDDRLTGGAGLDTLTGGTGKDTFIYLAETDSRRNIADVITDFASNAQDLIDLSAIDAIAGGADNAFIFRGNNRITDIGQVRVYTSGFNTFIDINLSGTIAPEMRIELVGIIALDKADFIL